MRHHLGIILNRRAPHTNILRIVWDLSLIDFLARLSCHYYQGLGELGCNSDEYLVKSTSHWKERASLYTVEGSSDCGSV